MPAVLSKQSILFQVIDALMDAMDNLKSALVSSVSLIDKLFDIVLDILEFISGPLLNKFSELRLIQTFADRPLSTTLPLIFVVNILTLTCIAFLEITSPELGLVWTSFPSLVFLSSFTLSLWSYYRTVTCDPGRVPIEYHPDKVYRHFSVDEKKLKRLMRFCKREAVFKPDRAHFCTPMNRNILKLDHFCAFTGNAVGWLNYRFFLQFLVYSNVGNAVALWKGEQTVLNVHQSLSIGKIFLLSQSLVLGGVLSAVLVPFLGFHLYLTSINSTTIEFCEGKNPLKNPYNLGFFNNWYQVMGANPLYWILPLDRPQHPGIEFPRNDYPTEAQEEPAEEPLLPTLGEIQADSWKSAVLNATADVNEFAAEIYRGFSRILFYS